MIVTPSQAELWSAAEQLCRQFDLGEVRQLEALPHQGYSNFNARLDTNQGAFVLRRYTEQPAEKITHELQLIDWLDAQGLPVVPPLRDPDGKARCTPNREHPAPWVVFPFVDGEEPEPLPATAREMGELAARLHQLPEGPWKDGGRENLLSARNTVTIADSLRGTGTSSARHFLQLMDLLAPEVGDSHFPTGLVHADLFPDNTIFREGNLVAVLDWEEACVDHYLFDLAMAMHGFSYVAEEWRPDLARSFLAGYEAGRPLDPGERESLPLFLRWTPLAMAGWHLRRYSLTPNPRQAGRIDQLLQRAETVFDCDPLFP